MTRRRPRLGLLDRLLETLSALRVGQDVAQVLIETLEQVQKILGARSLLLFYYDGQDEQLYRWSPGSALAELTPAERAQWIDFEDAVHLHRLPRANPLAERLKAGKVLSVGSSVRGSCARLLAVDASKDPGASGNSLLHRLVDLLFSLAERVFLLRRVHQRAIEEERDRIAQDFHDGPLQTFFSFDVHLQFIRQIMSTDQERAVKELEKLQELAREQGRELRDLILEMRPVDLENATLASVLRHVVESAQKAGNLTVHLLAGPHRLEAPRKTSRQTFQILREAINNARKHAHAQHVIVSLEESSDHFVLTIDDDGAGFKFTGRFNLDEMDQLRIGPVSIKRRAKQMGAELTVESTPGRGSRLMLRVPVQPAPLRPTDTNGGPKGQQKL